ncbi:MAG: CHAT domain-containing protein [Coleofasciculaceae cyanobacterium SM2_3_26]|nr:CHAT domain-containing protein [Coleofasciculaceae cyanobacterium SM2_3_26]
MAPNFDGCQPAIAAYAEAARTLQNLSGDLVAMQADLRFSFREQVEPVYREYVDLLLVANPSTQSEQQRYLEQAREAIEALQLAELDNFFREACLNVTPQPLDRLDPRAAALYTIILPDRLEAILSVPGQPMSHYAAPASQTEVEAWVDRTRQSFRRTSFAKERLPLAQELYRWLIQPAEAQLASGNIDTLVFVLDGALREIPMAVLHDGNNYLIERYRIAIAPGLQVLVPAVADNIPRRTSPKALLGGVSEASQGFAPLPGVERELSQIQSRLPAEPF